uniref:LooS10 n=1 Tax=Nocardiopsis flavescens TaxID=758803 RepID=A0A6M5K9G4_9ACTN|nr:LooS10 [Nocardiopsis flavescens]
MYGKSMAEIYDLVYRSRGKDFHGEAKLILDIVRSRQPVTESLLDVACGTAEHLSHLRKHVPDVMGVEISPSMLAVARSKLTDVPLHQGDMRDFDLGRGFDAVTCLFSSVAYMRSVDELNVAVGRMSDHLNPGGVIVIDPWWFPENFLDGYIAGDTVRGDSLAVARVARSTREGNATRVEAHYLVADPSGIHHFTDTQSITLFEKKDYLAALEVVGCQAAYLEGALSARGLFVGVRQTPTPEALTD